ncbi:MAG: hypothetical protein II984_11485 [Clostridia bacterium]|nr:hypothetical protein [Clostridia bacterium]
MRKFSLAKALSLVVVCVMLLGALALTVFATEDEKVDIVAANVYYGDVYQIMYAVDAPDGATLKATDSKGNEIKVVPFAEKPTDVVGGVECKIYILETGVAAQAIDEVITLTVEYGNKKSVKNYSILQYIYERSQVVDGAELEMLQALLDYAIKADVFLDKTPVENSFAAYTYVKVTGATVNGINPTGMYLKGAAPFANLDAIEYDATKYELAITVNEEVKTLDELKALTVADTAINVVVTVTDKAHEHSYEAVVTAPTCIDDGYTTYTCAGCGDTYTEAGDPATGVHVDNDGDNVCDTEGCEEDLTPATVNTIADVLNAADGTPAVINGTVTAIDAGWNATSNYMSVIITDDAGNTILCYKIKTELKKGDIVTVTGEVGSYNEAKQIVNATAVVNDHDTSYDVVIPEVTIAEALELIDGTDVIVIGTVIRVDGAWNSTYGNMNVTIKDESGKELYLYRLATKVELNDIIKVTGTMATYSGSRQVGEGSTAEIIGTHECTDYTEATCLAPAMCIICGEITGELAEHDYVEGVCSVCGHEEGAAEAQKFTASQTMEDLIAANGWTSSTTKQSFNLDDNVSVKVNGGSNTGKAYEGTHIRIYATDSPAGTLTISVGEGYELVSVKVTTVTGTYAFLYVSGTTTDICNETVSVSGSSVLLQSVKNGSNGKQVRVLAIEVVYQEIV